MIIFDNKVFYFKDISPKSQNPVETKRAGSTDITFKKAAHTNDCTHTHTHTHIPTHIDTHAHTHTHTHTPYPLTLLHGSCLPVKNIFLCYLAPFNLHPPMYRHTSTHTPHALTLTLAYTLSHIQKHTHAYTHTHKLHSCSLFQMEASL